MKGSVIIQKKQAFTKHCLQRSVVSKCIEGKIKHINHL